MGQVNTTEERVELTAIDKASQVFERVEDRAKRLGQSYDSLKASFIAVTTGSALWAWHEKLQEAQLKTEISNNRLIAVLRATGSAAGFTKQELGDYAQSLAESTQFTAGSFKAAETNLLKFGNIQGDVFKRALQISADYAAFTGGDVVDATQAIGKALSAPAEGTRALEREIGKLNFTTKERIESLLREGKLSEAQAVVLDVLQQKIGGTAKVMNTDLLKATTDVDKAWEDLVKTVAKTQTWHTGLEVTRDLLRDIRGIIAGDGGANGLRDMIGDLTALLNRLPGGVPGTSIGMAIGERIFGAPKGPTTSGRIIYPPGSQAPGASADSVAAQVAAEAAAQAAAADRIKEAWTKALPVVDAWNLRLLQMNGATEEQLARLQVLDRTMTRAGMEFKIRAPHGDIPEEARQEVISRAREIDLRRQNIERITAEYQALRMLVQMKELESDASAHASLQDKASADQLQFELSLIGRTTYEQQRMAAIRQVDLQTKQRTYDALGALPEDAMSGDIMRVIDHYAQAGEAQKRLVIENLAARRDAERSWAAGTKGAFDEYASNATNAALQARMVFGNAFQNMEDALVAFARTGKANFRNFADSLITDIIRIQTRMHITGPLAQMGSDLFSSLGAGAASLFGFREGGVMAGAGAMPLTRYAGGGVATSPQLAMFGEGSSPEAFVPLNDGRSIPVTMRGGGSSGDTYIIDARGADSARLSQLEAALIARDATVEFRAVNAVQREAAKRGKRLF